ncbi:MAG: flavodoxin family protein [Anaerovoracaceae bacterium]|jgi:multimeric flavodoxin WrbA
MKILVLNGSPHADGNTAALVNAFCRGAEEAGNEVTDLQIGRMNIAGCLGCERCHTGGNAECVIKDDMEKVYPEFDDADMIVLASPIYYFTLSGQLQCTIHRTYSIGIPRRLKQSALILTSGSDGVYGPAIQQYHMIFGDYMNLKDAGIITAHGAENKSERKIDEAYALGLKIQ